MSDYIDIDLDLESQISFVKDKSMQTFNFLFCKGCGLYRTDCSNFLIRGYDCNKLRASTIRKYIDGYHYDYQYLELAPYASETEKKDLKLPIGKCRCLTKCNCPNKPICKNCVIL